MEDLSGRQMGKYRIVAPLGEGGMAAVYKAYQPGMNRYVALKILPRHYASDPNFVARFSQEARVIANLEHQNILPIYDFGESEGYTYLVMRLVESGSLADLLSRERLSPAKICQIITQVGGALDYAHSRSVLHRDIKPSNILIDLSGNCLLADFGLAKMVESSIKLTQAGGILGTPAYMAPEQALGQQVGTQADIYALGVMLYEMASGRLPFIAETPLALMMKHAHDPLPLPRQYNSDLPESVERVILKAMAKSSADRYSSANQMVKALRDSLTNWTEEDSIVELSVQPPPRPLKFRESEKERALQEKGHKEEEYIKATLQKNKYKKSQSMRGLGFVMMGTAGLFLVPIVVSLILILSGQDVESEPNWMAIVISSAIFAGVGYAGYRLLGTSRKMLEQLKTLAAKEGNFYCCPCGKPMKNYYWMHIILCVGLFPWGLISLAFKLKKCRNCRLPYKPIPFSAR